MNLILPGGGVFGHTGAASEPPGPDDDFEDGSIASFWTAQNTGTATIAETGGQLVITCPTGTTFDWYSGTRSAPYLEQDFSGGTDFQIDADFSASNSGSGPTAQYQGHGFLILQDATNNIRFDAYHNGTSLQGFAASMVSGTSTSRISTGITSTHWKYLRLARVSSEWRLYGSPDGATYTIMGSGFTHALTINKFAIFAHRSGAAGQYVANVEDVAFS